MNAACISNADTTVRTEVLAGFGDGTSGITNSTAATEPGHGIGYAANGSGIRMIYTLRGDATLDGTVNFSALLLLAGTYTQTRSSNPGVSASFAADWALAEAEVAAVPEPTSFGLLAFGAGLLARRRGRNRK